MASREEHTVGRGSAQAKRAKATPKQRGRRLCEFPDCGRPNFSHGLCQAHNMQKRRGVELRPVRPPKPVAGEGLLWCGRCKQFRDELEFGWDTTRDQPKRTCRPCVAAYQAAYVGKNRDQVNLDRRLAKRGLRREQYDEILERQGGRCAICHRDDRPLDIDHCHTKGHVRGLLCGPCNRGLGFFNDDPALLAAAVAYIETERASLLTQ